MSSFSENGKMDFVRTSESLLFLMVIRKIRLATTSDEEETTSAGHYYNIRCTKWKNKLAFAKRIGPIYYGACLDVVERSGLDDISVVDGLYSILSATTIIFGKLFELE